MCLRKTFLVLVGLLLISGILGCAGMPRQAFNKDAHQDLVVIGVLEPAHSGEYVIFNKWHIGTGFGLIGGLVAMADMNGKTDGFTELAKARNFQIVEEFQASLLAELESVGYQVKAMKVVREKPTFLEKYDLLDRTVDAYLDPMIFAGYICASTMTDYIPTVNVRVRLIKRDTNDVLYQDTVTYGYVTNKDAVAIAAQRECFFENYGKIETDPSKAIEGLRKGLPMVAKQIARDLAR